MVCNTYAARISMICIGHFQRNLGMSFFVRFLDSINRIYKRLNIKVGICFLGQSYCTGVPHNLLDNGLIDTGFCQHGNTCVPVTMQCTVNLKLIHQWMEVAVIIISQGKEIDIMPQNYNPEFKKKFVRLRLEEFRTDHANQKWCTDFTHLFLKNGEARYNCSILDLYDRRVMASVTDHQRPRFPIYIESVCGILANLSM